MKIFNKKSIRLMSILTLLTISFSNVNINKVQALSVDLSNQSDITITERYSNPINRNAKVSFVDPLLKGVSNKIGFTTQTNAVSPMGVISEIYDHSTFTYRTSTRTAQLVGPREKEVTWKTMARGESYAVTDSTKLTGTVKIEGTVKAGIPAIVNQTLTASVTGSIEKYWSSTTTLYGPATTSSYNTRLFMHAVDYDQYSFVLNRTDYYKVYNGGAYYYTTTYSGTEYVPSVKSPVFMSYSKDINY